MLQKSQISIEYMAIIGFITVVTIPLIYIYYTHIYSSTESVASEQSIQIARKIGDAAEEIYYLGKPSQTTIKLSFPDNIVSTNLSNREVLFRMRTRSGVSDVVYVTAVNMSGSLPSSPGIHTLTIKAEEGFVQVSSK